MEKQNLKSSGSTTRLETSGCGACGEPFTAEEVLVGETWARLETKCPACKGVRLTTGHVIAAKVPKLPEVPERFNQKPCPRCGLPFNSVEREIIPGRWVCFDTQCETCDDSDRALAREVNGKNYAARRKAKWEHLCPSYYRTEGILVAAPKELRDNLRARVMNQNKGALVQGPTGRFKTTSVYHGVVKSLIWAGQQIRVARATEWRLEMSLAAKELRLSAALRPWKQCQWLFFDDLGQAAGTEASEEALYELMEIRRACNRPLIVTTQYTDDEFLARFRLPHRGEAIAQRIAELTSAKEGIFEV